MARYVGKDACVLLNSTPILGVTEWHINHKSDTTDITGMDSLGVRFHAQTLTDTTGGFTCIWDSTDAAVIAASGDPDIAAGNYFESGEIKLGINKDKPAWVYTGNCIITAVNPDMQLDNAFKITVEFQISGPLAYPTGLEA